MLKVIHIHTDSKFFFLSKSFYSSWIKNTEIFLNKNNEVLNSSNLTIDLIEIKDSVSALSKVKDMVNTSDLVILYDLDYFKICLVNIINPNVTIFWRFFGHEIYNEYRDHYLSEKTKEYFKTHDKIKLHQVLPWVKQQSYYKIRKYLFGYKYDKQKAISRIDYIICSFEEEYNELCTLVGQLPKFIQAPLYFEKANFNFISTIKKDVLIIGNSKNFYNNHIDILEKLPRPSKTKYVLPFSYGYECTYTEQVINLSVMNKVDILSDFLPFDEYYQILSESSALCSNAYRQMALSNILSAFKLGIKVYLNSRSSAYHFFISNGFLVQDIDCLCDDILQENLRLNEEGMIHNILRYNLLIENYSHDCILNFLNEHFGYKSTSQIV
jgi:hypothetical protein